MLGVFMDLPKAFDAINQTILFQKVEYCGVRGVALDSFRNYLIASNILWRLREVRAARLSRGFGSSARAHLLLLVRPLSRHTLSKRRDRHAPRVRLLQES